MALFFDAASWEDGRIADNIRSRRRSDLSSLPYCHKARQGCHGNYTDIQLRFILAVLLIAAFYSLLLGLRKYRRRIEHGKPWFGENHRQRCWRQVQYRNFHSTWTDDLPPEKAPHRGRFHGIMFIGALLLIFGHAVLLSTSLAFPFMRGWFGYLFLKLGREVGWHYAVCRRCLLSASTPESSRAANSRG